MNNNRRLCDLVHSHPYQISSELTTAVAVGDHTGKGVSTDALHERIFSIAEAVPISNHLQSRHSIRNVAILRRTFLPLDHLFADSLVLRHHDEASREEQNSSCASSCFLQSSIYDESETTPPVFQWEPQERLCRSSSHACKDQDDSCWLWAQPKQKQNREKSHNESAQDIMDFPKIEWGDEADGGAARGLLLSRDLYHGHIGSRQQDEEDTVIIDLSPASSSFVSGYTPPIVHRSLTSRTNTTKSPSRKAGRSVAKKTRRALGSKRQHRMLRCKTIRDDLAGTDSPPSDFVAIMDILDEIHGLCSV